MAKALASAVACAGLVSQAKVFVAPQADPSLRGVLTHASQTGAIETPVMTHGMASNASSSPSTIGGSAFLAGAVLAAVTSSSRAKKRGAMGSRVSAVTANAVKVGDSVPDVSLDKGFPPDKVSLKEFCKGKKVVLVGLPGAFTPTWSSTQVPGYLAKQDDLKAKGVSDVIVYCVNDGAVMKGWEANQGTEGSIISMMGDPRSEVTQALGLVLDHPGPMSVLGNPRCKRFSMLIDDGVIKTMNVAASDDDPAGDDNPTISLVEKMLEDL